MTYDVELEFLDDNGNVVDSNQLFETNDYDEAMAFAIRQKVRNAEEQIAVWVWDDDGENVVDSFIVKTFDD